MQQIYKRTPMPKSDFKKIALPISGELLLYNELHMCANNFVY